MKCSCAVGCPMNITVIRGKSNEVVEMPEGSTVEDLCSRLGLLIDAHIALRNNIPIPMDEVLEESAIIRLIKVASGG